MYRTIVLAYSTLDGVIEDPDGRGGKPNGGWMWRHGSDAVVGDKFKLGTALDTGVLVLGRKTWQMFAQIWPERTDDFSTAMNRIPKLVASRNGTDLSSWENSSPITGDVVQEISRQKAERDVIITGSASVVHALAEQDLIDEYRVIVFPELVGRGIRLFSADTVPLRLRLVSAETVGSAVRMRYERAEQPPA